VERADEVDQSGGNLLAASFRERIKREDLRYVLIALVPALIFIFFSVIYPIVQAGYISVHNWDLVTPEDRDFVGLKNYINVVTGYYFWKSMGVTAIFASIALVLVVLFSFGFALLINKAFKGAKYLQVIVLLPWAVPYVVTGAMWKWIYDSNYGLLNGILLQLGLISEYQPWLTQPWAAMFLLIIAHVWTETPLPTLLILAGLQSVPRELYEAALVDSAKPFAQFRYITFVWLKPILLIVFIYETLMAIRAFDLIYVITAGGPADFTATISFFTYRETFLFLDFGRATALCYIIVGMGLILIFAYFKALKAGSLELQPR